MENTALFQQLLPYIKTKKEVTEIITALDIFCASLYTTTATHTNEYFSHLPTEIADKLSSVLAKENISTEHRESIRKTAEDLESKLRSCTSVQLTIAFYPNESSLSNFSDRIKSLLGPETLIDLHIDATLIGGAIIIVKGKFKDYSIKRKLQEEFQKNKEQIKLMISS